MANLGPGPGPGLMPMEPNRNPGNLVNPANPPNPVPEVIRRQLELFADKPLRPDEHPYPVLLEGDVRRHPNLISQRVTPGMLPINSTQFLLPAKDTWVFS